MKRGDTLYCRACGREYTYRGGRPNPLCPPCYRKVLKKRKQEEQEKLRSARAGSGALRTSGPRRQHGAEAEGWQGKDAMPQVCVERLPEEKPAGGRKVPRGTMEALMKDPVGRMVHEIELENEERRKQGLPPLSYGQFVQKYKR